MFDHLKNSDHLKIRAGTCSIISSYRYLLNFYVCCPTAVKRKEICNTLQFFHTSKIIAEIHENRELVRREVIASNLINGR